MHAAAGFTQPPPQARDVTSNSISAAGPPEAWAALGISKPQGQLSPASKGLALGMRVNQGSISR